MNTLRIGIVGLAAAFGGFCLQACFTPQPAPECQVINGQEVLGVTNYFAMLKTVNATAACRELTSMEVGMTRYRPPEAPQNLEIGLRASPIVDYANGLVSLASVDASNDCAAGEECETCIAPPGEPDDNVCQEVLDPVSRVDPSDPDAKKLTARAAMTQFPNSDGLCLVSDFATGMNFEAAEAALIDGGTATFPEIGVKMSWSHMKMLMSAKVPGTAWTADLKYEEGDCTANYEVLAFWPIVHCGTDQDCSTSANLDAGLVTGSGISPDFMPTCNVDLGVCVPTVDVMALK